MKFAFEEPQMEVVVYSVNDVIATSPFEEVDHLKNLD